MTSRGPTESAASTDFASAVDPHYPALVQRLTLVLHDAEEAKDVAQDAYVRAMQAWGHFDGADVRAWLHTIALRLAFNKLREWRVRRLFLRSQSRDATWVMPERIDIWRAVGELHPRHRAALLLNVVDGYTQAEVGRILGAPEGTVASWVATAKRQLSVVLGEGGM